MQSNRAASRQSSTCNYPISYSLRRTCHRIRFDQLNGLRCSVLAHHGIGCADDLFLSRLTLGPERPGSSFAVEKTTGKAFALPLSMLDS